MKKLLVKVPTKTKDHIEAVEGNVITVKFGPRQTIKDFTNAPIVIGSNPTPTTPVMGDTEGEGSDEDQSS